MSLYDEVQQKEVNKEHVDNVKSYLGSMEQALDAARTSAKESEIEKILYHEGVDVPRGLVPRDTYDLAFSLVVVMWRAIHLSFAQ